MAGVRENLLAVVGGGIGGLASALGAAQSGKKVKVLEQAPEFKELGAGIQLAANGTNVLRQLGVLDRIKEVSVFPKRLVLMDAFSGEELSALNVGEEYEKRYGAPYIVLHRSDLHRILKEACEENANIELVTDQSITELKEENESMKLISAQGDSHEAAAVIGADGLWSQMRKNVIEDEPVCAQYVAYRGAIPMEEVTNIGNLDDVYMWIGPNMHVVQYPVRKGELYNQVVVFKSKQYRKEIEHTQEWGTSEEMDEVFAGTCEKVQTAISFISRQKRWPMFDREPLNKWGEGRFTLTGDAAHPMLQYLAQGACQALEDASYLTNMLDKYGNNFDQAFTAFQQERVPRTTEVQKNARLWGEIIHNDQAAGILLRNTLLQVRTENDFQFVDRFHGYNKTLVNS